VWGNPGAASAVQGETILSAEVNRLIKLINMLEDLSPP
jgi:creatinine amidohydrolase/Fe(II)-dependent formamide hydrolase-like protein